MSFLGPTNPLLIGLSKEQLIRKCVCEKRFDEQQFHNRKILRDSYPTLFTESEIKHGELLSKDRPGQGDHTYSKDPETVDDIEDDSNCDEEFVVLGNSDILNSGPAEKYTLETTALVVEFVDQLFDSVNCYPGGAIKGKLRKAVKKNSIHHKFWVEAIQKSKTSI